MKSFLALLVLLAVLGGGWWFFYGSEKPQALDPARVATVEPRDLLRAVVATGRVEPEARTVVMSRASGVVKQLLVDEGDEVHKGQILAQLDREQLEAQLLQDQGQLASAKARLQGAKAQLEEARARLDEPEVEFARRNAARIEKLHESGDVSSTEQDDAALRLAQAEYTLRLTRANIAVLEAGVAQAAADVDAAQASLERAQTSLRETTILSPIDGVVLVRDREVGDGVSSILTAGGNATPIMTLGDLSQVHIVARVDEVDVGKIYVGMRAVISVDAFRGRDFAGKVRRIAPAGTVDTNGIVTFEVEVTVEDPERLLRPDMTAVSRMVLEERKQAPALPQRALSRLDDGSWVVGKVLSLDPPRVEQTVVEPGVSDGMMVEILKGLSVGDKALLPSAAPLPGGGFGRRH